MKAIPLWKLSAISLELEGSMLVLSEDPAMRHNCRRTITKGFVDLTYDEAEQLILDLQDALNACREMDKSLEEYFEQHKQSENDES